MKVKWIAKNKIYILKGFNGNGNAVLIDEEGWTHTVKRKTFDKKYIVLDETESSCK